MYEIIDHTADIGLRLSAATLQELFVHAASATFDIMVSSKREFIPAIEVPIEISAPAVDQLMVRWLQEVLFIFENRRLVLSKFWIDEMNETHLRGMAMGLKFDPTRHTQKLDIKAVTYHKLKVEKGSDGQWHAEVIFDI